MYNEEQLTGDDFSTPEKKTESRPKDTPEDFKRLLKKFENEREETPSSHQRYFSSGKEGDNIRKGQRLIELSKQNVPHERREDKSGVGFKVRHKADLVSAKQSGIKKHDSFLSQAMSLYFGIKTLNVLPKDAQQLIDLAGGILKDAPNNTQALVWRMAGYYHKGEYQLVLDKTIQNLMDDGGDLNNKFSNNIRKFIVAFCHCALGQYEQASKLLLSEEQPLAPVLKLQIVFYRAMCQLHSRKFREAKENFHKFQQELKSGKDIFVFKEKKFSKKTKIDKWMQQHGDPLIEKEGEKYFNEKMIGVSTDTCDQMISFADEILSVLPKHKSALTLKMFGLYYKGNYQEIINSKEMKKIKKKNSDPAFVHNAPLIRGCSFCMQGEHKKAYGILKNKVSQKFAFNLMVRLCRAISSFHLEKWVEARYAFQRLNQQLSQIKNNQKLIAKYLNKKQMDWIKERRTYRLKCECHIMSPALSSSDEALSKYDIKDLRDMLSLIDKKALQNINAELVLQLRIIVAYSQKKYDQVLAYFKTLEKRREPGRGSGIHNEVLLWDVYLAVGCVYTLKAWHKDALKRLKKPDKCRVSFFKNHALYSRAMCYHELEQWKKARECFQLLQSQLSGDKKQGELPVVKYFEIKQGEKEIVALINECELHEASFIKTNKPFLVGVKPIKGRTPNSTKQKVDQIIKKYKKCEFDGLLKLLENLNKKKKGLLELKKPVAISVLEYLISYLRGENIKSEQQVSVAGHHRASFLKNYQFLFDHAHIITGCRQSETGYSRQKNVFYEQAVKDLKDFEVKINNKDELMDQLIKLLVMFWRGMAYYHLAHKNKNITLKCEYFKNALGKGFLPIMQHSPSCNKVVYELFHQNVSKQVPYYDLYRILSAYHIGTFENTNKKSAKLCLQLAYRNLLNLDKIRIREKERLTFDNALPCLTKVAKNHNEILKIIVGLAKIYEEEKAFKKAQELYENAGKLYLALGRKLEAYEMFLKQKVMSYKGADTSVEKACDKNVAEIFERVFGKQFFYKGQMERLQKQFERKDKEFNQKIKELNAKILNLEEKNVNLNKALEQTENSTEALNTSFFKKQEKAGSLESQIKKLQDAKKKVELEKTKLQEKFDIQHKSFENLKRSVKEFSEEKFDKDLANTNEDDEDNLDIASLDGLEDPNDQDDLNNPKGHKQLFAKLKSRRDGDKIKIKTLELSNKNLKEEKQKFDNSVNEMLKSFSIDPKEKNLLSKFTLFQNQIKKLQTTTQELTKSTKRIRTNSETQVERLKKEKKRLAKKNLKQISQKEQEISKSIQTIKEKFGTSGNDGLHGALEEVIKKQEGLEKEIEWLKKVQDSFHKSQRYVVGPDLFSRRNKKKRKKEKGPWTHNGKLHRRTMSSVQRIKKPNNKI